MWNKHTLARSLSPRPYLSGLVCIKSNLALLMLLFSLLKDAFFRIHRIHCVVHVFVSLCVRVCGWIIFKRNEVMLNGVLHMLKPHSVLFFSTFCTIRVWECISSVLLATFGLTIFKSERVGLFDVRTQIHAHAYTQQMTELINQKFRSRSVRKYRVNIWCETMRQRSNCTCAYACMCVSS